MTTRTSTSTRHCSRCGDSFTTRRNSTTKRCPRCLAYVRHVNRRDASPTVIVANNNRSY